MSIFPMLGHFAGVHFATDDVQQMRNFMNPEYFRPVSSYTLDVEVSVIGQRIKFHSQHIEKEAGRN